MLTIEGIKSVSEEKLRSAVAALRPSEKELKALNSFRTAVVNAFGHAAGVLVDRQAVVAIHEVLQSGCENRHDVFNGIITPVRVIADHLREPTQVAAHEAARQASGVIEICRNALHRDTETQYVL